jgi:hypothetical protein
MFSGKGTEEMQLKKREAGRLFIKLGVKDKNSKHHISGWIEIDGKKTLPIHYSNGNGDMPAKIADKFRRSLLLTLDEFCALKDCHMSKEEFVDLIRHRI